MVIRRRVMVRRRVVPRRIRHHPLTRWATVIVVVGGGVLFTQKAVAGAVDARHRWGDTRRVFVARHRIDVGDTIATSDVEETAWPTAVVSGAAMTQSPVGREAIAAIEPGEAVSSTRVAPEGLTGIAALVPPGWRAVAVPTAPTVIALRVGDHVDLIAGFDAAGASSAAGPALTVARDAVVVAVDEQRVTIAVRADDAERTAFAIVAGTVVPALRTTALR